MAGQKHLPPVYIVLIFVLCITGVAAGAAAPPPAEATASDGASATVHDGVVAAEGDDIDCERCHATLETNRTVRDLKNAVHNQPNHEFDLNHTEDQWCYDCHSAENMNRLVLLNGSSVARTDANITKQCAACHGPVYQDWQDHIHGKWTGSWENATTEKYCTDCHDPHHPEYESIEPEPAPREPPSGPNVAQSVLSGTYYFGVGTGSIIALGLIGYAATSIRRDN